MSPVKGIPRIEFGPSLAPNGAIHMVPAIENEKGEKRIMLGHRFDATCCHTTVTNTPNGTQLVIHSVIH